MTLLFIAIPVSLLVAAVAVAAFIWAARGDQYEDMDTPPVRMLLEDPVAAPRADPPQAACDAAEPPTPPRSP